MRCYARPNIPNLQQPGDWELKRIYLLPGWQGGGNGRALMGECLAVAREREAKRLLLAVYENNEKAVAFYARNGFAKIGETIFMVADVAFRDMVFARDMEKLP